MSEDVTPGPRQSGSPAAQAPPSSQICQSAFLRDPGPRGRARADRLGFSPTAWQPQAPCGLPGPQLGRGRLPEKGEVPGTQDHSEVVFVCRKSCPVPQGCGPSSHPAADLDSGSSWPRAGHGCVRPCVCVRPQSAIASPLNLVGSKLGLLAVTLAAWLSQCVFIFSFKPFWRFLSSQKGLNQMSHGTVLGGPHQAGSGSQAKLTSPGFTRGGGEEGSG